MENFHKDKSRSDGYQYICKACDNIKNKQYRANHKDRETCRSKAYYENNKHKIVKANTQRLQQRYRTDVLYRTRKLLAARLNSALRSKSSKRLSILKYLGCSIQELKRYLESKFQPGMSWTNQGKGGWEIDHIIPFAKFDLTVEDNLYLVCHYTNLQPMWADENRRKSNL